MFYGVSELKPMSSAEVKYARSLCHMCPVQRNCLIFAFTTDQGWGVWGGLTAAERERAMLFFESIEAILFEFDQGALERKVAGRVRRPG